MAHILIVEDDFAIRLYGGIANDIPKEYLIRNFTAN